MSYAAPRSAKLKIGIMGKVIGANTTVEYRPGKVCKVQRNPSNPGMFVLFFNKTTIAQVAAEDLMDYIQYTDGKPEGWQ